MALQNSIKKTEQLENRIKRLAFEAARAQKVTDQVTVKAEKLLEARERHQRTIQERQRTVELRKMDEERLRIKNISARQQGITRREHTHDLMRERHKVSSWWVEGFVEIQG
jgi:hypothetical protein